MLGADASGLELRCLAHYMARWDGGTYGDIVVNGDIHSANRDALGLEGKPGRDVAKRFIYAFLYGAGDPLLGWILDSKLTERQAKKAGKELRAKFLAGLPALAKLIDAVKTQALTNGYLTVLDGRRIAVRHEHAALNSLLQTAGALVCKYWGVEFSRRLTERYGPQGWDGQWAALLWIHDEYQMAVRPVIAEDAAEIVVASIRHMTDHFKFRCPLTGEAKLGGTWAETH
jgi:DNA polymerase I-like protein with 3'-5' exonuclease and polymerase domains